MSKYLKNDVGHFEMKVEGLLWASRPCSQKSSDNIFQIAIDGVLM